MRSRFAVIVLLGALALSRVAHGDALQQALAITDPDVLRALDTREQGGFGLGRMLDPARRASSLSNDALFALPAIAGLRNAIDAAFARAADVRNANSTAQVFDRSLLYSRATRFALAGIVDRMDRAYVTPETCGEVRLIYRLMRIDRAQAGVSVRLPMTLNLVLRAKNAADTTITCAELARRWLAAADMPQAAAVLMDRLTADNGVLASVTPDHIDRIEINLQIAYTPKSAMQDFRTDYLQQVFRFNDKKSVFEQAPLENQIDRGRLLSDNVLAQQFKSWLLKPNNVVDLDRGSILIPERFLAFESVAATPVGFTPSTLQPAFGLTQSDRSGTPALFRDRDIVDALQRAAATGFVLQNIRSPAGFARRLNDISCGGCHQVRGIGGFHFPGVDWMADEPSNTNIVPGSPHFIGDQPRRRDIAMAMRDGISPDFFRGFSDRPQLRGHLKLAGTEYVDGWGAHCYRAAKRAIDNDKSFASWTCANGLSCQPAGNDLSARIGMCFVGEHRAEANREIRP